MATLDDLPGKSITEMNDDELAERLRELRLSRRTPHANAQRKKRAPKASVVKEQGLLEMGPESLANAFSPEQAAELLKLLEGE